MWSERVLSRTLLSEKGKGKFMILITGASGMVGGAVLQEVRKTGKPFKAMYRNEGDAKKSAGRKWNRNRGFRGQGESAESA